MRYRHARTLTRRLPPRAPDTHAVHTKYLRPFLTVAQLGSISRAADELRRAPSAVSRSIQELEASLGVELFERATRRWLLTEAGRILQRRVQLALAELDQARSALCSRYPAAAFRLRNAPIFALAVHERRLELLFAFGTRRHISAAAAAVGVSQPAASMALHELEAGVGVPLFDRAHSGVSLTEAGEWVVAQVKRALTQLRLAADEISALQGVMQGHVVVGALPFSRPYVLPAAIGRVLQLHPRLHVRTVEASLDSLMTELELGDVDFLVGALPSTAPESGLVLEELAQQRMVVLARSDHPLARKRGVTLADTLSAPWVLPPERTPTRAALAHCVQDLGLPSPQVAAESSDISVIRGLLLEAGMLTAASPQLFQHELAAGVLVTLPFKLPGTERPIGILRRSHEHSSPGAQLLMAQIRLVTVSAACED